MAKKRSAGPAEDSSASSQSVAETSPDFRQGHEDVAQPLSEARAQIDEAADKARSSLSDGLQSASETYDDTASSVSSTYSSAATAVDKNFQQASSIVDSSMQQTADVVKMGAAWTMAISGWASDRSQAMYETGRAHLSATQDSAFEYMKGVVVGIADYPEVSYPAFGLAALVLLPGPRRFLFRQTFGRFRSEEGMFVSAQNKAKQLSESLTDQQTEADKLKQRLSLAWDEYTRGQSKLRATNRELQSLAKRVGRNDDRAQALLQDLRQLPSAQALALRAQVALSSASAQRQWTALEKEVYALSKRGL